MPDQLSFKGRVALVTGSGGGLGKSYALFFASRGANVVINDFNKELADKTAAEINAKGGGEAIANYNSVTDGDKIIKQIIDKWGRIDILINNAGILRDKSFKGMTDKEWDQIQEVHVKGAYSVTHAAWPHMRKQKYGRIINTASAAGIYGNFGQANYSAAKLALTTFARTLAREGAKYNINANAIAPIAASKMLETVMPPELLAKLKPEMVVPLVAYLTHEDTTESGSLFEGGGGWYGKLRWQRTKGAVFRADDSFTPAAVKARWEEVNDFDKGVDHPQNITDANHLEFLERAKEIKENPQPEKVDFKDQTVIVTGAGAGLGRAYALMYAKLGANVVINDMNKEAAEKVKSEVEKAGGKALVVITSVENGADIVKAAVDKFGTVHAVVNNAGILRDKSFASMKDEDWDLVYKIHVRGTYVICKAVWEIFQKQKYGRIVNTTSAVGLYGNFGQANYSTAKAAILGLTQTLAIEGKKYGILANTLAPNAGTAMTATIWPEEMVQAFKPDFVAPVVGYLTSKDNETTRGLYEVSGGWVAAVRVERTAGAAFPASKIPSPEQIKSKWNEITKFDENATTPSSTGEALESIMGNLSNEEEESDSSEGGASDYADPDDPDIVKEAKKQPPSTGEYVYTERDVALYNLGIGATEKNTKYVFEGDDEFQAIPTFGVIPQFSTSSSLPLDWLPNFSPMMLLHGEQYLAIKGEIPTSGKLTSESQVLEALDKGKAAAVTSITRTKNEAGEVVFENQSTVFIRGAGGFGGKKTGIDRGAASAVNKPPSRKPDKVVEEKTLPQQAAIYRLSGDYNPLHIDPDFAKVGGFDQPILHGLCFFGISGKHIYESFGKFKDIKVRFVGSLYPGETVVTQMWKEGDKVIFVSKCKERDTVILGAAAATLA